MKKFIRTIINLTLVFFMFSTFFVVKTWADEEESTNEGDNTVLVEDKKDEADEGSDNLDNDSIAIDENNNDKKEDDTSGDETLTEGDNIQGKDIKTEDDNKTDDDLKEDVAKGNSDRSLSKSNDETQLRNGYNNNETGYITFSADDTFTISLSTSKSWNGTVEYSTDSINWIEYNPENTTGRIITSVKDENDGKFKVFFRGSGNSHICHNSYNNSQFRLQNKNTNVSCSGNIETLLDYQTVMNGEHPVMDDYCYSGLFEGCTTLISAPDLPATELSKGCYKEMFASTSISHAPDLPATTLAESCYEGMFIGASFSQAPVLPATELAPYCYKDMLGGVKLTQSVLLPATELAPYCYKGMFIGAKLTKAPVLPATTLAEGCYEHMFVGAELAQVPVLPATELAPYCYKGMFSGWDGYSAIGHDTFLTQAPVLPATTLAEGCYESMFYLCESLENVPVLPATELAPYCYKSMFAGTRISEAPDLPATTLAEGCYEDMFFASSITYAPAVLPATTLAKNCYNGMFGRCSSLKHVPKLPATTLAEGCYQYMFAECTNLCGIYELPATTLAIDCYAGMFSECYSLTWVPDLPATYLPSGCYKDMFANCPIKISEVQGNGYGIPFRIPAIGTGISEANSTKGMFGKTIDINKTYYIYGDYDSGFTLGKDNNSFKHKYEDIFGEGTTPDGGWSPWNIFRFDDRFWSVIEKINSNKIADNIKRRTSSWVLTGRKFGGSCYGISFLMHYVYENEYKISEISDNNDDSDCFFDLKPKNKDHLLVQYIQYYYYSQYFNAPYGSTSSKISKNNVVSYDGVCYGSIKEGYIPDNTSIFTFGQLNDALKALVDYINEDKLYSFGYGWKDNGHRILITGKRYNADTKEYEIKLYDLNTYAIDPTNNDKGKFGYLFIKDDFSTYRFEKISGAASANDKLEFFQLKKIEDIAKLRNDTERLLADYDVEHPKKDLLNTIIEFLQNQPFIIETSDGRTLIYQNGEFSGDTSIIEDYHYYTDEYGVEGNGYNSIEIGNCKNIIITPLSDNCDIAVYNNESLYSVEGNNITTAVVSFENRDITISGSNFDFISYISNGLQSGDDSVMSAIKGSSNGTVRIFSDNNNYYAENTDSNDINVTGTLAYIGASIIENKNNRNLVQKNVKLNEHDYNKNEFLVTFETGIEDVSIPAQYLSLGSKITRPENVMIDGKLVIGWYKSGVFQNEDTYWDFKTDTIEENVVLYPKVGESSEHTHDWSIYSSGNSATVKCIADDCPYTTDKEYSVSIAATGKNYDGTPVVASITKDEDLPTEIEVSEIKYYGISSTYYEESETAPVNAGTYTAWATISAGDYWETVQTDFQISPTSIKNAVITLDDTNLIYNYGTQTKTVASVVLNDVELTEDDYYVYGNEQTDAGSYTMTITGQDNYKDSVTAKWSISPADIYVYSEGVTAECDGSYYGIYVYVEGPSTFTILYGETQGVYGSEELTYCDEGTYTVYFKVTADSNFNDYEGSEVIRLYTDKEPATVTKDPEAISNLKYDGSSHNLISAGEADGGIMKYALGTDGINAPSEGYENSVPQGKDAKTYYVWYKVEGDGNHGDVKPECITVEIAKISLSEAVVTLDETDLVFNGSEQTKYVASVVLSGVTISSENYTVSGNEQTNAGNYTLTVTGKGNYKGSVTASWSISPKDMTVSSQGVNEEYDGSLFEIDVTVTDPSSYTIMYGENKGVYDQGNLAFSDVGSYTVYYQITADNYNTYEGSETITINKATATIDDDNKPAAYSNLVYNDDVQDLVSQGYSADGTVLYSFDGVNFFEEIPSGIEAKTYNIYYKVEGDSNHDDSLVYGPIEATIAKLPVTVTADDLSGKYGEDIKELTWTVSENAKDLDLDITITTTATKTSPVNLEGYPITVTVGNSNVDPTIVNGKYVITKNGATVTASSYNGKYDGQPHGITVEVKDDETDLIEGNEAMIYYSTTELTTQNYLSDGSTDNITYTAAGTDETVYYYVASSNYDPEPIKGSQKVIIAKADPDSSIIKDQNKPVINSNLVYKEDEGQTLLTNPSSLPEGYTGILYSTDDGKTWSDTPIGKDAKTYEIRVKYTGNPNYEDLEGDSVAVEIKKATGSISADSQKAKPISGLVYSEQGKAMLTAPESLPEGYSKVQYSIDDGKTWTDSIPKGKGGDYTIKVKYIGDKNHNDFVGDYVINVSVQNSYYANNTSWVIGSSEGNLTVFKALVQDDQTFDKFLGVKVDDDEEYLDDSKYSVTKGSVRVTFNSSYLESLSIGKHTVTAYFSDGASATTTFTIKERTKPSTADYVIPTTGN